MLFYQTSQNTCCETCIWSRPLRQCPVERCTWNNYIDILILCTGAGKISKYPCVGCEILLLNNFGSQQFLVRRIFFTLLLDEALRPGISSVGTFAWRGSFHNNIDMALYFLGIIVSWQECELVCIFQIFPSYQILQTCQTLWWPSRCPRSGTGPTNGNPPVPRLRPLQFSL